MQRRSAHAGCVRRVPVRTYPIVSFFGCLRLGPSPPDQIRSPPTPFPTPPATLHFRRFELSLFRRSLSPPEKRTPPAAPRSLGPRPVFVTSLFAISPTRQVHRVCQFDSHNPVRQIRLCACASRASSHAMPVADRPPITIRNDNTRHRMNRLNRGVVGRFREPATRTTHGPGIG